MTSSISKRSFLLATMLPLLPLSVWALSQSKRTRIDSQFINGHIDKAGTHYVSGFSANGEEGFRVALADKAHSFAVNPVKSNLIISFPSLPGTRATVIDIASGKQQAIVKARAGRHFNGHGCFSPDGRFLFTSENIAETAEGVISVRDAQNFRFIREISGYGIGPHDIRLLPDGTTLVVASGGIQTHPDSGKRELNINYLKSALLFIDSGDGKLLARREIPIPRLSIRHLDVSAQGEVLVACQYKGKIEMPKMVGIQQGDGDIEMLEIDDDKLWEMKNYTASARIAVNGVGAVTCPRGDRVMFWDLHKKTFLKAIEIKDAGGIEVTADGKQFIISANVGELYTVDASSLESKLIDNVWQHAKWTNHMVKINA